MLNKSIRAVKIKAVSYLFIVHPDDDELWETQSTRSSDEEDLGMLLKFENRDELPAFDKHYR